MEDFTEEQENKLTNRSIAPEPGKLPGPSSSFAERLADSGLITTTQIQELEVRARSKGHSVYIQSLLEYPQNQAAILDLASVEFAIPIINLEIINLAFLPIDRVGKKLIEHYQALPLYISSERLGLVIHDPQDFSAVEHIAFHTGLSIQPVLANYQQLKERIQHTLALSNSPAIPPTKQHTSLDNIDLSREVDLTDTYGSEIAIDTPIVQFVNQLLQEAILRLASDIHIEPYENEARIRYRIDGILYDITHPPPKLMAKIVSRLKVLAQLNIAERRLPQDGKMKLSFSSSQTVDFRVSTLPTVFGEKAVIRVMNSNQTALGLNTIGLTSQQLDQFRNCIAQPHGMILVTGPTGSGKTISLYSALHELNTPQRNISSVEDPVEVFVPGVNQVQTNAKANLSFANTLRALLRQDPDIIMVGEIRDNETAQISIKAAQTGHLVFSTLHTNDAAGALTRLLNIGIAPVNVASSVHLVVAQRLVRRLCPICRLPTQHSRDLLDQYGFGDQPFGQSIYQAVGCSSCNRGYQGRTGIFEVMPVSSTISELILKGASHEDIQLQARSDGILTMRQSGLEKVALGITSIEEVERVTLR